MENSMLLPFIRNQYFFGKLLTQRDMEAEQTYFNNKRRLMNAILYGSGVVCGFSVLKADGSAVVIESGIALDGLGRELVLDKPVITRLSELRGFEQDRGAAPYVYLCAEYAETPIEPLHAMTDTALAETRFGRTEEGVRLYLRYGEPEPHEIEHARPEDASSEYWRTEALEKKLARGEKVCIYLARIHLVRWEEAYEIDRIDPIPFGQWASVPLAEDAPVYAPAPAKSYTGPATEPEKAASPVPVFGTAVVDIPDGARFNSLHFSGKIPHGLGMADVHMVIGLETDSSVIYGDNTIFQQHGYEWAVKTDSAEGVFQIGVRLKTSFPERILRFRWMATVDPGHTEKSKAKPQIIVTPGSKRMTYLQSAQFSATVHGLPQTDVIWSLREQDGGSITKNGYYIAPNTEGVFTICAVSAGNPEVFGIAFAIVVRPS